jgi:hypothetical protein
MNSTFHGAFVMSKHVHNQGRIRVNAPAATAFHFFTPRGEEIWIDHWRPNYVFPSDGTTRCGMVFTTGEGDEFTIWQLLDFDPLARRSRYTRTTPASRTGTVTIAVQPLDDRHAQAEVSYEMTALTAPGEAALAAYEGEAFSRMLEDWALRIERNLAELLRTFSPVGFG